MREVTGQLTQECLSFWSANSEGLLQKGPHWLGMRVSQSSGAWGKESSLTTVWSCQLFCSD